MRRFSGPDQVFEQVSGLSFFEDRTATFFSSLSKRNRFGSLILVLASPQPNEQFQTVLDCISPMDYFPPAEL